MMVALNFREQPADWDQSCFQTSFSSQSIHPLLQKEKPIMKNSWEFKKNSKLLSSLASFKYNYGKQNASATQNVEILLGTMQRRLTFVLRTELMQ
jgi:hypothetical protein